MENNKPLTDSCKLSQQNVTIKPLIRMRFKEASQNFAQNGFLFCTRFIHHALSILSILMEEYWLL